MLWHVWPFGVVRVVCVCRHECSSFVVGVCVVFSFCGRSVDALALRADEGRGGLRYASGS